MDDHCTCPSKRKLVQIMCCACGKTLYEPDPKRKKTSVEDDEESEQFSSMTVFTMGDGEIGQLGLGPDIIQKGKPTIVDNLFGGILQIAAGGMHSVVLTEDGQVLTFGMNDEGTLGRIAEDENDYSIPAKVGLSANIVQVSAGDSHTAAVADNGRLFIWGTFRDNDGNCSLIEDGPLKSCFPWEIMSGINVIKVSSGADHILCLTDDEKVYSFGNNECGQLGRTWEASRSEDNRGPPMLLVPEQIHFPRPLLRIINVWTGRHWSFAKSATREIYAWGLNNCYQLGFGDVDVRHFPEIWPDRDEDVDWVEIASGLNHMLALDSAGRIYSVGSGYYGQLGIGQMPSDAEQLRRTLEPIPKLQHKKFVSISCGDNGSFAVSKSGTIYCWGMGCAQLGLGNIDDRNVYLPTPIGEGLRTRKVLAVSAGGQHTMILADEPMSKLCCEFEGHILRN